MARTRILFVATDALDPTLARQWIDAGHLPTLRGIERSGFSRPTSNPVGLFAGSIWPSFATACSPAHHGRYWYQQLVPGTYRDERFPIDQIARPPFWAALSDAGRRVALLDLPKTAPIEGLRGVQLCDWGTHDPEATGPRSWPPELVDEVTRRFGPDPVGPCDLPRSTPEEYEAFVARLLERIRVKEAFATELLDRGDWDLFAVCFGDSHCVGHQCWHLLDPVHPRHDPELARRVGNPILEVYRALDGAIGRLRERAGGDALTVVLASHGFGPHYGANHLLDRVLGRLEAREPSAGRRLFARLRATWLRTPRPLRRLAEPLNRRLRGALQESLQGPDRAARRAFAIPNGAAWGAVRLNLVGREPNGRVHPGEEADRLMSDLESALSEMVTTDRGAPAVRRVVRTDAIHEGPERHRLPDLLVEWETGAPIPGLRSPRIGEVLGDKLSGRTGDHLPGGRLWCAGPGVSSNGEEEPLATQDVGATLAARLGLRLAGVDGVPIPEVGPDPLPS